MFTRWQMQYMERECAKQDFISITLLVIVEQILKVVRKLLQSFHFRQFDVVQILNNSMCLTSKQFIVITVQNSAINHLFLSW